MHFVVGHVPYKNKCKGFLLRIEAIPMNIYYARQKDFGQLNITRFSSELEFCEDEGMVSF